MNDGGRQDCTGVKMPSSSGTDGEEQGVCRGDEEPSLTMAVAPPTGGEGAATVMICPVKRGMACTVRVEDPIGEGGGGATDAKRGIE